MTLPGKTQPNLEKTYMSLPAQTQQKSNNLPLPAKTKIKVEGYMTTRKTYTTLIHKVFYYSLIPPFNYG